MVAMLLLLGAFSAKAAENSDKMISDTKTNKTVFLVDALIRPQVVLAQEGLVAEELPQRDERTEEVLKRWKSKQLAKWENLPQEEFVINASAYTSAADECGKSDGITSSGVKAQAKRTIACPAEFPFGAKISIEGMGVYSCEDRGGAIKGNKIDIYMESKGEAFAFGRRMLKAQVVF